MPHMYHTWMYGGVFNHTTAPRASHGSAGDGLFVAPILSELILNRYLTSDVGGLGHWEVPCQKCLRREFFFITIELTGLCHVSFDFFLELGEGVWFDLFIWWRERVFLVDLQRCLEDSPGF